MHQRWTQKPTTSEIVQRFFAGAAAGVTATVPMTALMEAGFAVLPNRQRYPLPPRETTDSVTESLGVRNQLREHESRRLALAAHFAYGGIMGSVFGLSSTKPRSGILKGSAFGLLVWAASYLGLLPALRILKPATRHPPHRNALMIAAHLVWGGVMGLLVEAFNRRRAH